MYENLEIKREFLTIVKELAKEFEIDDYFIVTEGASVTHGSKEFVHLFRNTLIEYELKNGGDPEEDWSKNH